MIDVLELLGDRKMEAHSTIVLSYAFDVLLFDGYLRRQLRKAGATNQIVFCDGDCYEKDLSKTRAARFLGKAYSVTPVHQAGAFHPKIYLLLGSQSGRLIIGSGNTTLGGLARNGELFGSFDFDASRDMGPHPGFGITIELIRQLATHAPAPVQEQIQQALSRSPWLDTAPQQEDGRRVFIGGPGRTPLLEQVLADTGVQSWDNIIVCSASFDRQLRAMRYLADLTEQDTVTCLVQPSCALIDGQAVQSLGNRVNWRLLTLPKLNAKSHVPDRFSHAKLYIFQAGDREFVAYGSANASSPALLDSNTPNTEVLVLLPPVGRGDTVKKLELLGSLESGSAFEDLRSRTWSLREDSWSSYYTMRLCGVGIQQSKVSVSLSTPSSKKELRLALAETVDASAPACIISLSLQADRHWTGSLPSQQESLRVAWLVDKHGQQASNCVVLTWQDVTHTGNNSGKGQTFDEAIIAMQHGDLPSMAFYTILDRAKDLSIGTRSASKCETKNAEVHDKTVPRSQASFYSEKEPDKLQGGRHIAADRSDLDTLGALVQPLASVPEEDEEALEANEEEERKNLDEGIDEHTEEHDIEEQNRHKPRQLDATIETVHKKAKRLARRLNRAAHAAENKLGQSDLELEVGSIARQIWMMHVAAYMAGRDVDATDGKAVCLGPLSFARYAIRMGHAIAGGKRNGLLTHVPEAIWDGYDGENLKRGLAFCWTCVRWSAAYLINHWSRVANPSDHPKHLAESIPELAAASFQFAARQRCDGPDEEHTSRRLPAYGVLPDGVLAETTQRIDRYEAMLRECSTLQPEAFPERLPAPKSGELVYSSNCGLAVALNAGLGSVSLASLSCVPNAGKKKGRGNKQPPPWVKTYRYLVMRPETSESVPKPSWWPTEAYLNYLQRQQPTRR